jgi:neopullulanase
VINFTAEIRRMWNRTPFSPTKGVAMTQSRRLLAIGILTLAGANMTLSQISSARAASHTESSACPSQTSTAPCIDKIDPPDWWAGLPDPMLLVHGQGLGQAQFAVHGKNIKLTRTQFSSNGHWAFLWLQTASASAQTLWITASSAQGQVRHPFQLARRSSDPNAHRGFSSADAMYLIMTDRFSDGTPSNDGQGADRSNPRAWHGGDFSGIQHHLDYLHDLGVTTVWTTPVASNAGMHQAYHGYAATDLYAVDPHFGTLEDYRHLSDALHARGMKLVIDMVPNHLGVHHPWVLDSPTPDWFHGTLAHHVLTQSNFAGLVDPHAPRQAWNAVTSGWFTDSMPDLNQENPLVSRYLIQNAIWWIESANLDGIRLDTFPYVGRAFWHDFHAQLHSLYPHLTTVGEVFNGDAEITSYFAGGAQHQGIDTGLDTPFDFPVFFSLRNVLIAGKPMTDLTKVLRQDSLYPHPERLVPFIGNHDTTRFLTEANGSVPRLKLALGLVTTLRGMPQIYSGDEIAMTGGKDPDDRHDFPGGFAGDAHNAFIKAGRTATEEEVFAWTSGLLKLRASYPALQTGLQQNLFADADAFAYLRTPSDAACTSDHSTDPARQRLLIVVNKSQKAKTLDLTVDQTALDACTEFHPLAPATGAAPVLTGGKLHIEEPAESLTVYAVR